MVFSFHFVIYCVLCACLWHDNVCYGNVTNVTMFVAAFLFNDTQIFCILKYINYSKPHEYEMRLCQHLFIYLFIFFHARKETLVLRQKWNILSTFCWRDKRSVQDLQENSVSVMHSKPACILSLLEDAMVTVGLSSAGNDCWEPQAAAARAFLASAPQPSLRLLLTLSLCDSKSWLFVRHEIQNS